MSTLFGTELDEPWASEPIQLSTVEFDVLWEHLDLGEMPLVLKVASPGRTHTERAQLVSDAWQALEERGLATSRMVPARLQRLLGLLSRPQREVDGRLWFGRRTGRLRLLAAATGDEAVLATLANDGLTLRDGAATGLAREALSVLPSGPAGPGESITLPSAQLDAAAASSGDVASFEQALCAGGMRSRDAALLCEMIKHARRRGQFGAAVRDRWGRRRRAPRVIGFFDSTTGRYLQMRRPAADGELWSTISPADHRLLHSQLTELLAEAETDR